MASAEFWYEFASTYSYPAALRVGALADAARREPCLAPVPARADLRGAGLARLAVQHLSRQGPLHVARPRADLRGDGRSAQAARAFSTAEPARRAGRARARRRPASEFLAPSLRRRIRPRHADRRSRDSRRIAGRMRRRSGGDVRAGRKARPTRRCSRPSARGRSRSASSARPVSSPRTAKCSGATTGSNRGSTGPRGPASATTFEAWLLSSRVGPQRALDAARRERTPTGSPGCGCAAPDRPAPPSACR